MASSEMVTAGWIVLSLYMAVVLFFVIKGAFKIKSMSDYAVGSIAFSPIAVGLSLAASMTSAATFIINPGFIALYGISGVLSITIFLPIGAMISLVVFTKGFKKYGNVVKATTMAQWIGSRYKSSKYSFFFAILSLLLITFIVLICVGLTKVLSKTLNANELYVLLGIITFIFGYMMFGGANSMVYTNAIQAILMLIVAFILLGSGFDHFSNGVNAFLAKLKAINPNLASPTNPTSFLFRDYFEIIVCQIIVGIAIVCQPHIITKSLLLKSNKDVNRYLTVGIITEIIFFSVVIVGLYARLAFPDLTVDGTKLKMDGIMSAYVVKNFPVYIAIVVVMGLISAGISTLEGLIQSVSTTVTVDIIKPLFGKFYPEDEKKRFRYEIFVNRFVIFLLAVISAIFSYEQLIHPKLSVAIFAQNGVYGYFAAAFVPVLFGTFLKNVPKIAPIVASATAIIVHFTIYYGGFTPYMKTAIRNPGVPAAIAITTSVAVGILVLLVVRNKATNEISDKSNDLSKNHKLSAVK